MGNENSVENVPLHECPLYVLNLCQISCQRFYTPESLTKHAQLVSSGELLISLAERYRFLKEKVRQQSINNLKNEREHKLQNN